MSTSGVIELAGALRQLGVSRFQWGDLAFDFAPSLAEELGEAVHDTLPPIPDNAVASAALRLANRARSVA